MSSTGAIQAGSVIGVSTAIAEPRRGGPRTAPLTPEEVASIVASGRAVTTVPEIVAVPFAHLGIRAIPLIDADPAVLMLVWPEGAATPMVEDLVLLARANYPAG